MRWIYLAVVLGLVTWGCDDGTNVPNPAGDGRGGAGGGGAGGQQVTGPCDESATPIHEVQGSGTESPLVGSEVVVQAVVVGEFVGSERLGGFYIQEHDADIDGDDATSEGLFVVVDEGGQPPLVGDTLRVTGVVAELDGETMLTEVSDIVECGDLGTASAVAVVLPVASLEIWESFEGMVLSFEQPLVATDNRFVGSYGQIMLAPERLTVATQIAAPGPEALAQEELNQRSMIRLDDGSAPMDPRPVPYLDGEGTLRLGRTVKGLRGVLAHGSDRYKVHPTELPVFEPGNPRPAPPAHAGTVRVASLNLLNFFTTVDDSGSICGPAGNGPCIGADNAAELERQRAKLVAAISALDAAVVALIEVENDDGATVTDLVQALNDAGPGSYDSVQTGTLGPTVQKLGMIYQPSKVLPQGAFAVLDSSVDPTYQSGFNKPTLAQTFDAVANGARFTVAVVHLKSKGGGTCNSLGDVDAGDGQGPCNGTRTAGAEALATWLANDPTGSGDTDVLIVGDFNAYLMEDPVQAMLASGWTDVLANSDPEERYSFVFGGARGALDYVFSTSSLAPQVAASFWHINADEPKALDYNDVNPSALYQPDPYRSSDHDPLVVDLQL